MQNVVLTVHLILAALLIGVVLLQRSEGGGLGIGGGGGGIMTGRQAANALSKATWILAIGFLVTSMALFIIAGRQAGSGSVLDRIGGGTAPAPAEAPAGSLPALPAYVPPPVAGQPVTPPAPAATGGSAAQPEAPAAAAAPQAPARPAPAPATPPAAAPEVVAPAAPEAPGGSATAPTAPDGDTRVITVPIQTPPAD